MCQGDPGKVGECRYGTYAVSLPGLFFCQFGLSLASAILAVLLLLSEAFLLLQSQCNPQGPGLLLLDLSTVQ